MPFYFHIHDRVAFRFRSTLVSEACFGASIRPLFLRRNKKRVTARKEEGKRSKGRRRRNENNRYDTPARPIVSIRGLANQNAYYVAGRPAN